MEVVVVPGVGHAPMLDEPVAVDAIDHFLRTAALSGLAAGPPLLERSSDMEQQWPSPPGSNRGCLPSCCFAYIFNFLDRQILGILAEPIKADLASRDAQFGAIGGLAFALLYSVLGVPLGPARRPHQPQLGHRRRAGRVERLHRAVRHGDQLSASCSSPGSASASAKPAASRRPMR